MGYITIVPSLWERCLAGNSLWGEIKLKKTILLECRNH